MRDQLVSLLSQPPKKPVILSFSGTVWPAYDISLNDPDRSLISQVALLYYLSQREGKAAEFKEQASLGLEVDGAHVMVPIRMAFSEAHAAKLKSPLPTAIRDMPADMEAFYGRGNWLKIASCFGTHGLVSTILSPTFQELVTAAQTDTTAPQLAFVKGAVSGNYVSGNNRMVIVGDALGDEPSRAVLDTVREVSIASKKKNINQQLAAGVSREVIRADQVKAIGHGAMAVIHAASELVDAGVFPIESVTPTYPYVTAGSIQDMRSFAEKIQGGDMSNREKVSFVDLVVSRIGRQVSEMEYDSSASFECA